MASHADLDTWLETADGPCGVADHVPVEQAIALFNQASVHLPARRADGIDPVARLRHLQSHLPTTRRAFYRELLLVFAEFGDRHTRCILPSPWGESFAFLPFIVNDYRENGSNHIMVTGSTIEAVRRGDVLVSWNDRPVMDRIREHMPCQLGVSPEARYAKALQTLTIRPLALMPPPVGLVDLEVRGPDNRERRERLAWRVADAGCLESELAPCSEDRYEVASAGFSARTLHTSSGPLGWIKIPSLRIPPEHFLPAFVDALDDLPTDGVVLDLRCCEEGFVPTGEQLLQLFTTASIEPQPFQFRITDWVRNLVHACPALKEWREPVEEAAASGETYSKGRPLTKPEAANALGRRYNGPILIVVNALTYSTAEMLAAGLQDHGIGLVLGTSAQTGGGGGSPWPQGLIHRLTGDPLFEQAAECPGFQFAVRRCQRVRANSGCLLEGTGVRPDLVHRTTRRDLLEGDADLVERAGQVLARHH